MAAGERAVTTIFNTAPFTSETARLAKLATIIVSNETEFDSWSVAARLMTNNGLPQSMRCMRQPGQTLVVTLGAKGAAAIPPGTSLQMPA